MSLWAIVPVKPFLRSKSRLAGVLSPDERAGLSREFLAHALRVLQAVPEIAQVLVISRDPVALALARAQGARPVTETGAHDLNTALTRATQVAQAAGAQGVLVLPTDLPLITAQELRELIPPAGERPLVAIAPDRHEAGTNALLLYPPDVLSYAFGPGSFARHLALAQAAGAQVRISRAPGLSLDVDEPEDLALYRAAQPTD